MKKELDLTILKKLNYDHRYLIDYANLISKLLYPQKCFSNKEDFEKICNDKLLGIPVLAPYNLKFFYKNDKNNFFISKKDIASKIFNTNKLNYIGLRLLTANGNKFSSNLILKKKYHSIVNEINNFNLFTIKSIQKIKKKYNKIVAFQTRNIPHFGHQVIVDYLLKKNNIVIINPILGPKKKGDLKSEHLISAWKFIISKNLKYRNRVKFLPIISNMYYAGPREASHHAMIRQNIGFDSFSIGRDHAGAENLYKPLEAINFIKKNKSKFKINIMFTEGGFFCPKCNKAVIKKHCPHIKDLINISGTDFRNHIEKKTIYKYADVKLQLYLINLKKKIFQ